MSKRIPKYTEGQELKLMMQKDKPIIDAKISRGYHRGWYRVSYRHWKTNRVRTENMLESTIAEYERLAAIHSSKLWKVLE